MYGTSSITKVDTVNEAQKQEIQDWIEEVLEEKLTGPEKSSDFFDCIKDGVYLCRLLNKIQPNTCKKYKKSPIAFVSRNNIQIYINGCKKLGLPSTETFETRDLFDGQMLSLVIKNIYAVSAVSHKISTFDGPYIQSSFLYANENKREFTQEQLNKSKSAVPFWSAGSKKKHISSNEILLDGYGIIKSLLSSSALKMKSSEYNSNLNQRERAITELITTERTYVSLLKKCLDEYSLPLVQRNILDENEHHILFSDLGTIYQLNDSLVCFVFCFALNFQRFYN